MCMKGILRPQGPIEALVNGRLLAFVSGNEDTIVLRNNFNDLPHNFMP